VALKEGSLVVNSSQGGGSKDTWVLADDAGPEGAAPNGNAPGGGNGRAQSQSQSQSSGGAKS
jgi:hypothetical protein